MKKYAYLSYESYIEQDINARSQAWMLITSDGKVTKLDSSLAIHAIEKCSELGWDLICSTPTTGEYPLYILGQEIAKSNQDFYTRMLEQEGKDIDKTIEHLKTLKQQGRI